MHRFAPLALRVSFVAATFLIAALALGVALPRSLGQAETGKGAEPQAQPAHRPYRIAPPDILVIDSLKGLATCPVHGSHQVRPDGTIGIGAYGSVHVKGLTLHQAREAIAAVVHARMDPRLATLKDVFDNLSVDVLSSNSSVYYVVLESKDGKDRVTALPVTGKDRVLDALSRAGAVPRLLQMNIWVMRPASDGAGKGKILNVNWQAITRGESLATNHQLLPGDLLVISAVRDHS